MKPDGFKAHVILTTYESFINNYTMFKAFPRWECVIVDEGQRMKSDSSLIFARLKQINSVFRILLTGTPLNNNLRELFNLLNFLDPKTFRDLKDLETRFENLNESLLHELHDLIAPYILRRIKRDVLKLPPKVEIIIPIAMTPVQKQVTREILHRNVDMIENIVKKKRKKKAGTLAAADADVVDITESSPAPKDEAAAGQSGTNGEAGPSGPTNSDVPGASEAARDIEGPEPAQQNLEAAEPTAVDVPNGNEVLVEDSQPPESQAVDKEQPTTPRDEDAASQRSNGECSIYHGHASQRLWQSC